MKKMNKEFYNEAISKISTRFEIWENNGGGINMYILDENMQKCVACFTDFEYGEEGSMFDILSALTEDGEDYKSWDNTMEKYTDLTPEKIYTDTEEISAEELIADNEGIYIDNMGGNALYVFGVEKE